MPIRPYMLDVKHIYGVTWRRSDSRGEYLMRGIARVFQTRVMQVTHHYQHYQHDYQHIAIRSVSTLVPPSGKKARRALGLVPSRIVNASLLRASLRPRRRRVFSLLSRISSSSSSSFSSSFLLLNPTSYTALLFLSFWSYLLARKVFL